MNILFSMHATDIPGHENFYLERSTRMKFDFLSLAVCQMDWWWNGPTWQNGPYACVQINFCMQLVVTTEMIWATFFCSHSKFCPVPLWQGPISVNSSAQVDLRLCHSKCLVIIVFSLPGIISLLTLSMCFILLFVMCLNIHVYQIHRKPMGLNCFVGSICFLYKAILI